MPYVDYIPLAWQSLQDDRCGERLTSIRITVSDEEIAGLQDSCGDTLDSILNKIRPAFLDRFTSVSKCISCQTQTATQMVNTIAFHPQSPDGPVIVDYTPFAVCDSTTCVHAATRRAHAYRMEITATFTEMADSESEVCDNCNVVQNVSIHGRLKRCARCKVKMYCSKKCQREHWNKTHKHFCKSVGDCEQG